MADEFAPPAQRVKITDFEGQLLLITAHSVEKDVPTDYGPADCIVIDMVVIDPDGSGYEHVNLMVFQKVLQGQLRSRVGTGQKTLGTLTRGTAKKPGQDAPWILADPTEADQAAARKYLNSQSASASGKPPF